MIGLQHYMVVSAILFVMGVLGIFINRKNIIVILMAIELILLAVNLNLVAFSAALNDLAGQVLAMLVLTVAAGQDLLENELHGLQAREIANAANPLSRHTGGDQCRCGCPELIVTVGQGRRSQWLYRTIFVDDLTAQELQIGIDVFLQALRKYRGDGSVFASNAGRNSRQKRKKKRRNS